jgi:hypothetical protein
MFKPNLQQHSLNDVVSSSIRMLHLEAEMHGIKLKFSKLNEGGDRKVLIDQLRI